MTTDSVELNYWLSAKERARIYAELARQSDKPSDPTLYYMTHPWLVTALDAVLALLGIRLFLHDLPRLWERDVSNGFGLGGVLVHLVAFYVVLHLIRRAWGLAASLLQREGSAGEGVMWGAHQLQVNSESLKVSLPASESIYRWTAFLGLKKTKRMLLLMLTPRSAVAVPTWAFKTKTDEQAFCDLIESHIKVARLRPEDEKSTLGT